MISQHQADLWVRAQTVVTLCPGLVNLKVSGLDATMNQILFVNGLNPRNLKWGWSI